MQGRRRVAFGAGVGLVLAGAMLSVPVSAQATTANGLECTITGTAGADVLRGTSGDDVICGLGGNDVLYGAGDDDVIIGGDGADVIYGGDGNDQLLGGDDVDVIFGGNGDDTLDGGAGDDVLFGGAGDDVLIESAGKDTLNGGLGADRVVSSSANDARMWELMVQQRYVNLPAGSQVRWGEFHGSSRCLTRSSNGWTNTLGPSVPELRFLLEGSKSVECRGVTVNGRWQVRVDTPGGKSGILGVSVDVTLPSTSQPMTVGQLTCSVISGNATCTGSSSQQIFAPLPLILDATIGVA